MSHNPDPNPTRTEEIDVVLGLEKYAGNYNLRSRAKRWFDLLSALLFSSFHVWQTWLYTWRFRPELNDPDLNEVGADLYLSLISVFWPSCLVLVFGLIFGVRHFFQKSIRVYANGIGFDLNGIKYSASDIGLMQRIWKEDSWNGLVEQLQFTVDLPRKGLGRLIPWPRTSIRFRLP